uniref:methionine gamma-lyase family protein n=1 Tax=Traorella massiliensis TaxID=1903263 RepID=UPI00248EB63E
MILEQINPQLLALAEESDVVLKDIYKKIDTICLSNSNRILSAFIENRVSYSDFSDINGYGNYDEGRDKLEKIFATVLGCEDALVRPQIMSGTNAIYLALSALLKHGDTMISLSGTPYDSLQEMIGIIGHSSQSLKANGVHYEQIELVHDDFDDEKIIERLKENNVKLVEIQRSRGYSHRKSLSISKIERIISKIREVNQDVIIMVDNCYGEFIETKEPTEVGADIMAGSLIKNPGGGLALTGGYIAGRKDLVEMISYRLTTPGIGKECGLTFGTTRTVLQGFFMAPYITSQAVMGAIYCARMFEKLGYEVLPKYDDLRSDIIQVVRLKNADEVIAFCQGVQAAAPVDSYVKPEPWAMPGYEDEV